MIEIHSINQQHYQHIFEIWKNDRKEIMLEQFSESVDV